MSLDLFDQISYREQGGGGCVKSAKLRIIMNIRSDSGGWRWGWPKGERGGYLFA